VREEERGLKERRERRGREKAKERERITCGKGKREERASTVFAGYFF
jgi:hypothetical protein